MDKYSNNYGGVAIIEKEKCEGMNNGYKLNKSCIIFVFDSYDNLQFRLRISPSHHGDKIIICNIDKVENEHDQLLRTGKENNNLIRSLSTINTRECLWSPTKRRWPLGSYGWYIFNEVIRIDVS